MQLTAAILNAGLGDLTIGLEMAGFRVIAAYETDEKSIAMFGSGGISHLETGRNSQS